MSDNVPAGDAVQQLRDLCAEPQVYVTAGGERVEVAPLKVRQLGAFARAVSPLLDDLAAVGLATAGEQSGAFGSAVVRRADEVAQAVSAATARSAEWVGEQAIDDLVGLAALVVEVNADFFVRRLLPKLEAALPAVTGRILALMPAVTPSAAPETRPTPQPAGSA